MTPAPARAELRWLSLCLGVSLAGSLGGCADAGDVGTSEVTGAVTTINGLNSSNGLKTTASGRAVVAYLVRCALPAGSSLVKADQYGASYTFAGLLGMAPQWEKGAC